MGLDERLSENTKITVEGTDYNSEIAAARAYEISENTYNSRRSRGWSIEEALEIVPRANIRKDRKLYIVIYPNGKEEFVTNMSQFSRDKGWLSEGNLIATLTSSKHHTYHGYSLREPTEAEFENYMAENPDAFGSEVGYKRSQPVKYQGVEYPSKRSFCRTFGLTLTTFNRALDRHGNVKKAMVALGKSTAKPKRVKL